MYSFVYHKPQTSDQATALVRDNEDAKFLAGGMTLLPTMKQRLAAPPHLVDLNGLEMLSSIRVDGNVVEIGAMTRHVGVATSPEIGAAIPALAALAGMIGDPAVRNRGTIGGSVANNDPAADYPAACLALGATIHTNKRSIPADDYFRGLFETALEDDEMIVKITFPIPEKAAYEKFRNPASRYAIVGVFVAKGPAGVRVAVTGAGSGGVFRETSFERALEKNFSAESLEGLEAEPDRLNSDIHADAEYRAHLIGVMARRAVAQTERA